MDFKDELKAIVEDRRAAVRSASDKWTSVRDGIIRPALIDAKDALLELGIGGDQWSKNGNAIELVVGRSTADPASYKTLTFTLQGALIAVTSSEPGMDEVFEAAYVTPENMKIKIRAFFKQIATIF